MGDYTGKLGRQRHQKRFIALVKAARLRLLHDQHTEHTALMNDGHTQERVERLLANTGQQAKPGVIFRIFQIDRLSPFGNQADQTIAGSETRHTHHFWMA